MGSRDTYSPTSKCSPSFPHQDSRRLATNQYEISGLVRFFHGDSNLTKMVWSQIWTPLMIKDPMPHVGSSSTAP
ncbi:MAG: hypothetical protein K9M81_02830 [Chthoniobacterales bacterium]|nr:hypothetical protein [Chthoniobacterales bacterium]